MLPSLFNFRLLLAPTLLTAAVSLGAEQPSGLDVLPKPWIVAHRGGPLTAPEHTMEAYVQSTVRGNMFVELDCQVGPLGEVVILHDSTLDRTTTSTGKLKEANPSSWNDVRVNGVRLLGSPWTTYSIPRLNDVVARFANRKVLFVEAKDYESRKLIPDALKRYGVRAEWVVVNAFYDDRLQPARDAGFRTCLNLTAQDVMPPPDTIRAAGNWAVSVPLSVGEGYIRLLKSVGLKVFVYTLNRHVDRETATGWGVDGIYSDDPEYLDPDHGYRRRGYGFSAQQWLPGMIPTRAGRRGYFALPNRWGIDASATNEYFGCLQGWLCPIGVLTVPKRWVLEVGVTFDNQLEDTRWANVAVLTTDQPLDSDTVPTRPLFGYHVLFHKNGGISIYRYDGEINKAPVLLKTEPGFGGSIAARETVRFRIATTEAGITAERVDGRVSVAVHDVLYRGAYLTFGAKGLKAEFSDPIVIYK